jgi:hypothetical protein
MDVRIATWEIGYRGKQKAVKICENPNGYGNKGGDEASLT